MPHSFKVGLTILAFISAWTCLYSHISLGKEIRPNRDLNDAEFNEIITNYMFIGDFSQKEPLRLHPGNLFWKYPFKLSKPEFPIFPQLSETIANLPAIEGDGRPYEHLNRGRILLQSGEFQEARSTLLAARARFGKTFDHHRFLDYLIGIAMVALAKDAEKTRPQSDPEVTQPYANGATFLNWATIVKAEDHDSWLEEKAPDNHLYLSALYFKFNQFNPSHATAEKGLQFLRRTGRKEHRSLFHQIQAENWIRNRSYLRAVQEFDVAIRQDPDPQDASAIFTRVGDIYFDLNNYELAADVYNLGSRVDRALDRISPQQAVLHGESLFWLKNYSQSQKLLNFGIQGASRRNSHRQLDASWASYALLRVADNWLGRYEAASEKGKSKLRRKAVVSYLQVKQNFPKSPAAEIAELRMQCLQLSEYEGNNPRHARNFLRSFANGNAPGPAQELALWCLVKSHTFSYLGPEFLQQAKELLAKYPKSQFLEELINPVKEIKRRGIEKLYRDRNFQAVADYYVTHRKDLFQSKLIPMRRKSIFYSLVRTNSSNLAKELWNQDLLSTQNVDNLVLLATYLSETEASSDLNRRLAKAMSKNSPSSLTAEVSSWIRRIEVTKSSRFHRDWIQNLLIKDVGDSFSRFCERLLPKVVSERTKSLFDYSRKTFFGSFPSEKAECTKSFLNAEYLSSGDSERIEIWEDREKWPVNKSTAPFFWRASEILLKRGKTDAAKAIWEKLASSSPTIPERKFAKARLDSFKTETEKLWNE